MTTIKIVETQKFIDSSKALLPKNEIEAIRYLLANKPAIGEIYDKNNPELLSLEWRDGEISIIYIVSNDSDLSEIYLLLVRKNDSGGGGPGKSESTKLRELLDYSIKIGLGIGFKKLVETIFSKVNVQSN